MINMSDKEKKIPSSPKPTQKRDSGSQEIKNSELFRKSRKPTMQAEPPRTDRTTTKKDD